ncbi:hypothetical protein ANCDUO_24140, partial [Ancylostoma duodenale]
MVYRIIAIDETKIGSHSTLRLILPAETMFLADAVELSRHSRANVLSLGLGGGAVNSFLQYNFPEMNITVVEISAQMISLARKWFDLQIDDHHRVIHADGLTFLKQQEEKALKKRLDEHRRALMQPSQSYPSNGFSKHRATTHA